MALTLEKLGLECQYRRCDVAVESQVKTTIGSILDIYERIDILVNNAGVVLIKSFEETTKEEFDKVIETNLGGTFLFCKYVIPVMRKQGGGVIVNMSSVAGHVGQAYHAIYGSTKGAISALTRSMAWELAPYKIRVNSISPGSVDTPMLRTDVATESKRRKVDPEVIVRERTAHEAFQRWASPREIASVVAFLASDGSSFVNGKIGLLTEDGQLNEPDRRGNCGSGGIGRRAHLPGYLEIPEAARVTALCDVNETSLATLSSRCHAKAYTKYEDLLADPNVDAVDVCLPHYLHGRVALAALEAGKHVIVEKPIATSVDEAEGYPEGRRKQCHPYGG